MMNAFWASVNFDAFIAFNSSQPGEMQAKILAQIEGVFRERIIAPKVVQISASKLNI